MEITIAMIEQVMDATAADYYTVKQALLDTNGDVEAAISKLNYNQGHQHGDANPKETAYKVIDYLKTRVKEGNVNRIRISKNDKTILSIPVNLGIVGGILIPWPTILGVLTAYGLKCKIEIVTEDGKSEELHVLPFTKK